MSLTIAVTLLTLAPADLGPAPVERPHAHSLELGVAAGVFVPSKSHGLRFDGDAPVSLAGAGLDLSLRLSYLPLSFLGVEAEGSHISLSSTGVRHELYTARGHLIALYPAAFTPFVVAGGGLVGLVGGDKFMGADHQAAFHWGAGVKTRPMDGVTLRADMRHVMAMNDDGMAHHFEFAFGVAFAVAGVDGDDA